MEEELRTVPRETLASANADAPRDRVTNDSLGESTIAPGWSADKRPRTSKTGATRFTVADDGEETLIKFLDPQPFAPIYQHWVATKEGRRAYVCLDSGCPLCAYGDKPKSSDWFNVVVMGDDPSLQVWYATADPTAAIRERSEAKRTAPLNKSGQYFAVSKRKASNGFNTYSVDAVKEDELGTDWGIQPLTAEQLSDFTSKAYDSSLVRKNTKTELEEIAKQYFSD
jgi:hypothetical protein